MSSKKAAGRNRWVVGSSGDPGEGFDSLSSRVAKEIERQVK